MSLQIMCPELYSMEFMHKSHAVTVGLQGCDVDMRGIIPLAAPEFVS